MFWLYGCTFRLPDHCYPDIFHHHICSGLDMIVTWQLANVITDGKRLAAWRFQAVYTVQTRTGLGVAPQKGSIGSTKCRPACDDQLGMKCNFLSRVLYLAKWENMFLVTVPPLLDCSSMDTDRTFFPGLENTGCFRIFEWRERSEANHFFEKFKSCKLGHHFLIMWSKCWKAFRELVGHAVMHQLNFKRLFSYLEDLIGHLRIKLFFSTLLMRLLNSKHPVR